MVVGEVAIETDVVVIGGGPGGYTAAIRLGQLGKSVVLIEKEQVGGVCLHRGCIPSKALIHTAKQFHDVQQFHKIGIKLPIEETAFDLSTWQEWKSNIISQLNKGILHLCRQNGVTIVKGQATFLSDNRIGVETDGDFEFYRFQEAIIATGSRPAIPSSIKIDGDFIVDSTSILELKRLPTSLSIIGGGYIGVEIGIAFAKLGVKVTIIEMAKRLLPQIPVHLVRHVVRNAKKLGISIKTETAVKDVVINNEEVKLLLSSQKNGKETITSDKVLVTTGRIPNTDEIGLEQAGVCTNEYGYIEINEQCHTNIPHIFAIGDITPGPALAHRAAKQGVVAAEVIGGLPSAFDTEHVPYVIFSDPQIAGVGYTKEEAEQLGYNVKEGVFPISANGYAVATNQTDGFVEVIVDSDTHALLGLHVVGADAANLIGEGVLAFEMSARVEDLALSIHPHPTLTEGWLEAASAALGHAIHVVNE